jgi:hypothetical protein
MDEAEIDTPKLIDDISYFLKSRKTYHDLDTTEFIRARNLAAGMGWFTRLGKAFGESRANITINPLASHIDSTVNAFAREPFIFQGMPEEAQSKINHKLQSCLRETCELGISYLYIYHTDDGEIKFRHVSAMECIHTKDECVIIKKEKKSRDEALARNIWYDSVTEHFKGTDTKLLLTHFKLDKDAKQVTISSFDGATLTGQTTLNMDCLPVIPIKGKTTFLNSSEKHYRGYYYKLSDIVAAINLNLSVAAERVFTKTPMIAPIESFINDNGQYLADWESNEPRNLYLYSAKMPVNGQDGEINYIDLPPPTAAAVSVDLDKLNNQLQIYTQMINQELGSQLADENRGNETAIAVLSRNRAKEDSRSEILSNLNYSAKKIAACLKQYIVILGQPPVDITVTDQLSSGIRLRQSVDIMLATQTLPDQERLAILKEMRADDSILQAVMITIQNKQNPELLNAQQQIQQLTAQIQMMQNENKIAEAMYQSKLLDVQEKYNTKTKEMELEREIKMAEFEVERAKIELEYAKLAQVNETKGVELGIKQAEAIDNISREQ